VDSAGNLYIADGGNERVRKVSGGTITTIYGDGGAHGSFGVSGVAVDSAGNVYIADNLTNRIFKVSGGNITTVAGNGNFGFSGDGGPATSASLLSPYGVAVDSAGNLYIADGLNNRIRMVSNGTITTVAGNGTGGSSGDGGPATNASLNSPYGVAVDSVGNLYIADTGSALIRKVSGGTITTVAGNRTAGFSGDGSLATSASLLEPRGVAVDPAGDLYIADTNNDRIRRVSGGVIMTFAGNGAYSFSGDGGLATSASLDQPFGVTVDSTGAVYIADYGNNRIRKVSGGIITTLAGNGHYGFAGDGGPASSALLMNPWATAVDSAGNLYIADYGNNRIRKVSGGMISTVAGNGSGGFSGDGGLATSASIDEPVGVAVDAAGSLYIADSNNNRIRKVSNGIITTVAGNGTQGFSGDGGPATSASINLITDDANLITNAGGVATDLAGNLYIADAGNARVRKVSAGTITTVAGNGQVPPPVTEGKPRAPHLVRGELPSIRMATCTSRMWKTSRSGRCQAELSLP